MSPKDKAVIKRVLDYTAKPVEVLTLEELKQTASERNAGGKPINSVEHWELFDMIIDKISSHTKNFVVNPIYTTDGGNRSVPGVTYIPYMEKDFGTKALQASLLRRAYGSITLKDGLSKDNSGTIVIAFHQQGIQIGYGINVHLCSNLSLMGRPNLMSTYGEGQFNKISSIDKMVEVVGDWINQHAGKLSHHRLLIDKMKKIKTPYEKVAELIGDLNILRVDKDVMHSVKDYALNQSQISKFTEEFIKKHRVNPESVQTLWDVYNIGTEFHKPGVTDLPLILPNNVMLFDFIADKYKLS